MALFFAVISLISACISLYYANKAINDADLAKKMLKNL